MNRTLGGILRAILLDIIRKKGPLYGSEITREVERVSGGKIVLKAGSLYPALHRFVRDGLVCVETCPAPNSGGRVNYYVITEKGQRALAALCEEVRAIIKFGEAGVEL